MTPLVIEMVAARFDTVIYVLMIEADGHVGWIDNLAHARRFHDKASADDAMRRVMSMHHDNWSRIYRQPRFVGVKQ